MSELFTEAKPIPDGTGWPARFGLLVNMVAKYIRIGGLNSINGINFGPNTPSIGDSDKPWLKTDGNGAVIGWFWFKDGDWVSLDKVGTIYAFHGDSELLPSGHRLCDGSGQYLDDEGELIDIPDLRNKFIRTAGTGYELGATGGSDRATNLSVNLPAKVDGHKVTVEEIPDHTHFILADNGGIGDDEIRREQADDPSDDTEHVTSTGYAGQDAPHSHNLGGTVDGTADVTPPFYALTYIIYTAT